MPSIEINDAVHKTIRLSEHEHRVLNHPYVQRLRFIRQLGFVSFVYPSATHERFSHALGTMHVAGKFADQLFYNGEQSVLANILAEKEKGFLTKILRLSGLLHDIGHAPFSHTAEKVMPSFKDLRELPFAWFKTSDEKRLATHEDYTVLLLAGMTEGEEAVLNQEEAQIISSLVHHKKIKIPPAWHKRFSPKINTHELHTMVRSIVSGDIDADRMDYLLRDSHFTGVVYGHFDFNWLIANLGVVESGEDYIMSISEPGVHALEHYLFARYHMYVQVYMHKTVKIFEYYFHRALDEGETFYQIPANRSQYVALRDSSLLENLFDAARKNPSSWSSLLVNRRPAKRIARMWEATQAEEIHKTLNKDLHHIGVKSHLVCTKNKFLDLPSAKEKTKKGAQGSFLFDLAAMPLIVVKNQFGVISFGSIADHSFLLKHYHRDISVCDFYILPDDYQKHVKELGEIMKKFHSPSPSEIIIEKDGGKT